MNQAIFVIGSRATECIKRFALEFTLSESRELIRKERNYRQNVTLNQAIYSGSRETASISFVNRNYMSTAWSTKKHIQ